MVHFFTFIQKFIMNTSKISLLSKVLLFVTALLFIGSLFVPMWRIELEAPQYPEGLVLQLYANKIGGDVAIINGLNHYIGMATLHTENFFEFTILPYIFGAFGLISLVLIFIGRRKAVLVFLILFVLFVVLAGVDFYRWNYEYGHNLDPNAAIVVPGMAYQPPLIGYKQLLNFGAYSIPDTGGLMLVLAGILLATVVLLEYKIFRKAKL
jgi:copper chaperone NosL